MPSVASCKINVGSDADSNAGGKSARDRPSELALIKEIENRERENRKDLQNMKQLIVNESNKQMKVKLKLQIARKVNGVKRRENAKLKHGVQKAVDEMENVDGDNSEGFSDRGKQAANNKPSKNVSDESGKPNKGQQLNENVQNGLNNLGEKLRDKQKEAEEKRSELDRLKNQLDEQESSVEDKRGQLEELKQNFDAETRNAAKVEQIVKSFLKDFYRTIQESPKEIGRSIVQAFPEAAKRIIEIDDENKQQRKETDELKERLTKIQDNYEQTMRMKEEDKNAMGRLEVLTNRYSTVFADLTEHREHEPMPSPSVDETDRADYLTNLFSWLEKEMELYQQQMADTEESWQQAGRWNAETGQKQNGEVANLNNSLKQMIDKLERLKSDNDEMQDKIDRTNFEKCMRAKRSAKSLKNIVKETVECLSARPEADRETNDTGGEVPEKKPEKSPGEVDSIRNLEKSVKRLKRLKEGQEEETRRIEASLARLEKQRLDEHRELDEQENECKERLLSLDRRKEKLIKEIERLKQDAQRVDGLKKKFDALNAVCDTKENELREKEEKLRALRRENATLTIDVINSENQLMAMTQSLDYLKKSNGLAEKRIKRENETLNELNSDLQNEIEKHPPKSLLPPPSISTPQKVFDAEHIGASQPGTLVLTSTSAYGQPAESLPVSEPDSQAKREKVKKLLEELNSLNKQEIQLTNLVSQQKVRVEYPEENVETATSDSAKSRASVKSSSEKSSRRKRKSRKPEVVGKAIIIPNLKFAEPLHGWEKLERAMNTAKIPEKGEVVRGTSEPQLAPPTDQPSYAPVVEYETPAITEITSYLNKPSARLQQRNKSDGKDVVEQPIPQKS